MFSYFKDTRKCKNHRQLLQTFSNHNAPFFDELASVHPLLLLPVPNRLLKSALFDVTKGAGTSPHTGETAPSQVCARATVCFVSFQTCGSKMQSGRRCEDKFSREAVNRGLNMAFSCDLWWCFLCFVYLCNIFNFENNCMKLIH